MANVPLQLLAFWLANSLHVVDPAFIRRFDYLRPAQAWTLFAETAARLGIEAEAAFKPAIARLALLTPGDFANVARQSRLRQIASSRDLYQRLQAECAAKPEGRRRPIGF